MLGNVAISQSSVHIIPKSVYLQTLSGEFVLIKDIEVNIPNSNSEVRNLNLFFTESIALPPRFWIIVIENVKFNSSKSVNFISGEKVLVAPDLYVLKVSSKHVDIKVSSSQGMFVPFKLCYNCYLNKLKIVLTKKLFGKFLWLMLLILHVMVGGAWCLM